MKKEIYILTDMGTIYGDKLVVAGFNSDKKAWLYNGDETSAVLRFENYKFEIFGKHEIDEKENVKRMFFKMVKR